MHLSKSFIVFSAVSLAAVAAIDPITLTVGTTAFVASGAGVGVAAAALAALAIAKEVLIVAAIKRTQVARDQGRGRGRRQAEEAEDALAAVEDKVTFDMKPLFKAIVESDTDDCAKLMVCHAFASANKSPLQTKVVGLLSSQLEKIHADPALGVFQVAAIAGNASGNPELCSVMYSSCPKTQEELANLVPVTPHSS